MSSRKKNRGLVGQDKGKQMPAARESLMYIYPFLCGRLEVQAKPDIDLPGRSLALLKTCMRGKDFSSQKLYFRQIW